MPTGCGRASSSEDEQEEFFNYGEEEEFDYGYVMNDRVEDANFHAFLVA